MNIKTDRIKLLERENNKLEKQLKQLKEKVELLDNYYHNHLERIHGLHKISHKFAKENK